MSTALNIGNATAGTYLVCSGACRMKRVIVWNNSGGNFPFVYDAASAGSISTSNLVAQFVPSNGAGGPNTVVYELDWQMNNGIVVNLTTSGSFTPMNISIEYEV